MRTSARYVVGIDLGTTNTVVAFVDMEAQPGVVERLALPQVVRPSGVEPRATLPSFLYLASPVEFVADALDLPWAKERSLVVGAFAQEHGWRVPMRLVASAKSWLGHAGIDRRAPILPVLPAGQETADVERVSPVTASARYLEHVRDAWDHLVAQGNPAACLVEQDVYLTVPASFDAVARELTVEAATQAGLQVTLLEEPQAAFYAWLNHTGDAWRQTLGVGDVVLVCDVGGGTTDFSLIAVSDDGGNLTLERVAVGDHILLGGDNMDLSLAALVERRLAEQGTRLDAWQSRSLVHACRRAKEILLADGSKTSAPVTVMGRGRQVIGASITSELARSDVTEHLINGFFPLCGADERPRVGRRSGLRELGLPYAADAAVTRHLAQFLGTHGRQPTAVLFNGGVMKGAPLRQRVLETLDAWSDDPEQDLTLLGDIDYDLAVAQGAAYYGLVRRGKGIRIRGGTARSYYIGLETAMPAVPGLEPPLKAVCVAPFGMEEGSEAALADEPFGLVVGEPAEFRLFTSSSRKDDAVGVVVDELGVLRETAPLELTLAPGPSHQAGQVVPIHLRSRVTEVGTLELWCVAGDGEKWKLEFDIRAHD